MGKKSKRSRAKKPSTESSQSRAAPALRQQEEETLDNLRFEDPFPDEYEQDDEVEESREEEDGGVEVIHSWNPLTQTLPENHKLEMDESAYKMYHALTPEWPCLSFDFVRDDEGEARTRFPMSLLAVAGTQADRANRNSLVAMKLSDLTKTKVESEDDLLGEEFNKNEESDEEDSDDDEDDELVDLDPVLEHYHFRHTGGVNRVRVWPQQPEIVATWSDAGKVSMYNISSALQSFGSSTTATKSKNSKDPFFIYSNHTTEGYAMDWSSVKSGQFATGDCDGYIHIWQHSPGDWNTNAFTVAPTYEPQADNMDHASVEDLQWSPTEATVLASAECGGFIRIYDIRAPHKAMLGHKIHANGADVNVLSWNKLVSNLIATGGDDGVLSVWDLRNFGKTDISPLARFTCHKTPITAVEWHPSDESMLAVSDTIGSYVYDLSVEQDEDEHHEIQEGHEVPPQLLFAHSGSEQFKEVHWHPQITSCLMTTALTGFNVFIPSNL